MLLLTVLLVSFSSSGFMYFELADKPDLEWGDALWWSIVTMTTVGYGDFFAATTGGRVAAVLAELRNDPKTKDSPVVLIDALLEELPEPLAEAGLELVRGDASKESTDNANLAAALTLEHLNPGIFTVAECIDPERVGLRYRAGCDAVVCLTTLATNLVVHEMLDPGVQMVIGEATNSHAGQTFYLVDVLRAENATYGGARRVLEERGCAVLGIEHEGKVVLNPEATLALHEGDRVVCIAPTRPDALRL